LKEHNEATPSNRNISLRTAFLCRHFIDDIQIGKCEGCSVYDINNMTDETRSKMRDYCANPSFIRALKDRLDEDTEYDKQITYYKHTYPSKYDLEFLQQNMFVIPVQFNKEHKHMLAHCKEMLEYQNGQVAIHPRHNKLITSLRTAVGNGEG
jgi:hypothetical protein